VLDWISSLLGNLQQSKGLLGVTLLLVYGLGTVFTMIGGEVRVSIARRRRRRWDEEAEYEAERIRHGWDEENSDEWSLTNETYHAAAPREQRVLNHQWRERVNRAYNSQEWPQQRFTQVPQTAQWPTWSPEELATPGRHRFDDTMVVDAMPVSPGQGYTPRQLRALVADTSQFEVIRIDDKELVGVGQ